MGVKAGSWAFLLQKQQTIRKQPFFFFLQKHCCFIDNVQLKKGLKAVVYLIVERDFEYPLKG